MSALSNNPLVYPPKHVFDEGEEAVIKYLTNYANTMINTKDVSVMLIGRQEAGKTSLGLCMAGKIVSAEEIKLEDRTQLFDVYDLYLRGTWKKIFDSGGQKENMNQSFLFCAGTTAFIFAF